VYNNITNTSHAVLQADWNRLCQVCTC